MPCPRLNVCTVHALSIIEHYCWWDVKNCSMHVMFLSETPWEKLSYIRYASPSDNFTSVPLFYCTATIVVWDSYPCRILSVFCNLRHDAYNFRSRLIAVRILNMRLGACRILLCLDGCVKCMYSRYSRIKLNQGPV